MSGFLRGFGLFLLPLCGWLAGDAVQAETTLHLAALQRNSERCAKELLDYRALAARLYR